jgi:hypothetical protein
LYPIALLPPCHLAISKESKVNEKVAVAENAIPDFEEEISKLQTVLPGRVELDKEKAEHALAKLLLTLIELIRQLLERQALRRIEGGSLTEDEIERMGQTFLTLSEKMDELKEYFGFEDEDLNLNLGPLGDLL